MPNSVDEICWKCGKARNYKRDNKSKVGEKSIVSNGNQPTKGNNSP